MPRPERGSRGHSSAGVDVAFYNSKVIDVHGYQIPAIDITHSHRNSYILMVALHPSHGLLKITYLLFHGFHNIENRILTIKSNYFY